MDLFHIPAGIILTDEFLRIIQFQFLLLLYRSRLFLLIEIKSVRRLMTDRTFLQFGKLFPLCILTVEEGGVLNGKMERLDELYRRGIRLITLTWNYENCIGSPNSLDPQVMERGLKPFGIQVVERMNELGMIIDVSHLSDGGFWDCIRCSRTPIVASHSNARSLCSHPRNLTDEMLRALGNKGGVAGVNFYSAFLREKDGTGESVRAGLEDIVRHMRRMMDQAGEDAVALGTDFDGFETEALPEKIRGVQDMDLLWEAMKRSGITSRQIDKIAYGNVSRIMKEVFSFQA